MQAIERVMQITEILARETATNGISISELTKECDLALSTLHRILKSMVQQGLAEQDMETKLYKLGPTWMEYGLRVYDTMDFVSLIRPEMDRLSKEIEESIYFSKWSGYEAIIIERIDNENNQIRIYDKLGLRIPMDVGAANKSMLAAMDRAEAEAIVRTLVPAEEQGVFRESLRVVQEKGFAVSHGERTEGTSSIGVAVSDRTGSVVGAISVGCVSFNLTDDRLDFITEELLAAKKRIAEKFGRMS
ncbi:IclR family transcriptional regulator [Sporosarcina sp. NCCP-2716]|uniref:IclR family transcriptional regulator n=1 Tax=Sporosarcina sp. NCCP-2716 TaxID=2943679 RepID=UPI00203C13A8|nr:IclR family transcriptional regulator [Sporosarcina sp. NCCP-2716]GKV70475.1 IclR family transcriptional regulator [Sporosarcina sp. NCCP-2716]